mgnify:CR=1 FL=1
MSTNKEIKNIMDKQLPMDIVNSVLEYKGRCVSLPFFIKIYIKNYDYDDSKNIYEKTISVNIVDDTYDNIVEYQEDQKYGEMLCPQTFFECYVDNIYKNALLCFKFNNQHDDGTLHTETYFQNKEGKKMHHETKQNLIFLAEPEDGVISMDSHKDFVMMQSVLIGKFKEVIPC